MRRLALATLILSLLAVAVLATRGGERGGAEARPAYTRTCDKTSALGAVPRATEDDARLGGARLVAFRRLFETARAEDVYAPERGTKVLKAALVFSGRRDLTIAVPRTHRAVLRLQYEGSHSHGHSSVRFRPCGTGATGYPGALIYTGPWPACVPLDVTGAGGRTERHVLSLGAGPCQAPG